MQLGAATRLNLLRLERHLKLLRRVFPKRSLGLAAIHKALGFVEVGVRFIRVLGAAVTPDEGMPVEILLVVKALRFLVRLLLEKLELEDNVADDLGVPRKIGLVLVLGSLQVTRDYVAAACLFVGGRIALVEQQFHSQPVAQPELSELDVQRNPLRLPQHHSLALLLAFQAQLHQHLPALLIRIVKAELPRFNVEAVLCTIANKALLPVFDY